MHLFINTLFILITLVLLLIVAILLDIFSGLRVKHALNREYKPKTGFNNFRYFSNGHELYEDMEQSIRNAKNHIHLSFFIFTPDEVGNKWLHLLKQKAVEGVEVRILIDALNGFRLRKQKAALAKEGVHLAFSGKLTFPFTFYYLNRRNHRKIMVIDGRIGYFGGFNVSREYIGRKPEMGPWHDNHLRIIGESVHDLQRLFLIDWKRSTKIDLQNNTSYFPEVEPGPSKITLLGSDGKQLEDFFAEKLNAAQSSIFIGSPYFIPSERLMKVLQDKLMHGVTLTIVLPMKKDHGLVQPASYLYLKPLVENGARLYHFYQGFYHAKLFIVDRQFCYLGTANFDQRSLFWNDELSGFTKDPVLVHHVLRQLEKEIRDGSKLVSLKQIQKRSSVEKIKSIFSGWIRFFL
ncbi:phosphatidylserine/phosphatidylglycerophosphate/cardiolipin synthase family protein [Sporolactobacillus kofuensis]|uniref:Phosphatidylserine/phosphatidylglycerophosphate/ cardiolipin synthase family protein n=1 Tax=Sporolactobacillus kofuensis TaxID=269672 RepID=A0ABW1WHD1_9BACL|nr:phospholipase D-like domain-containing protein [Sporolactobacillus kofuensis]MCO7176299.1 phospholipase D-like domain-containing protein [Sporolactobacillus kofuensis]